MTVDWLISVTPSTARAFVASTAAASIANNVCFISSPCSVQTSVNRSDNETEIVETTGARRRLPEKTASDAVGYQSLAVDSDLAGRVDHRPEDCRVAEKRLPAATHTDQSKILRHGAARAERIDPGGIRRRESAVSNREACYRADGPDQEERSTATAA